MSNEESLKETGRCAAAVLVEMVAAMTDREKVKAMRALGVKWRAPHSKRLPVYPHGMTEETKRKADALYDSISHDYLGEG